MEKSTVRLLMFIVAYMIYLCIGSLIFATIEAPVEEQEIADLKRLRSEFLDNNQCVDDRELEDYVVRLIKATRHGIRPVENVTTFPNWNFASAFLFSGTLVTTIGYGDIAPLTNSGKVFAIVFALIGIPMTAVLLTAIVERLLSVAEILQRFMGRHYLTQPGIPKSIIRAFNVSIINLIIVTFIILLPALFFVYIEKWGYFEALYFCFITLTTIGLGDYTPGDGSEWLDNKYRSLYKISCVIYFLVGLSFVVLMLEMCAKVPEDHPGTIFSCHRPVFDDDEHEMIPLDGKSKKSYDLDSRDVRDTKDENHYELLNGKDEDRPYPASP